jgi:hypothetical protein
VSERRRSRRGRGRAEGRKAATVVDGIVQAERRARTEADRMRAVGARYHEDIEMLDVVKRAAPFVPRIEAAL